MSRVRRSNGTVALRVTCAQSLRHRPRPLLFSRVMATEPDTLAAAVRRRDQAACDDVLAAVIRPAPRLVDRPWGGTTLARAAGLPTGSAVGRRIGESFELAAADSDEEAAVYASVVAFADGSTIGLGSLFHACPEILGEAHIAAFGYELPLLPKVLDIGGLLSVQAHPPGHPELYVVLDAEPGATIHLGLRDPSIGPQLLETLEHGARISTGVATFVRGDADLAAEINAWLLGPRVALPEAIATRCAPIQEALHELARINAEVLEHMHTVEVAPGMAIHNGAIHPSDGRPSAMLHALGNPEGRSIVALEIRAPGPTLRLWDHGRIPARPLAAGAALEAAADAPNEMDSIVVARDGEPFELAHELFSVARVGVGNDPVVREGTGAAVFVHVCRGEIDIGGRKTTRLGAGQSALVPAAWASWTMRSPGEAQVVLAWVAPRTTALSQRSTALDRARAIVDGNGGPRDVIAIANGGDAPAVVSALSDLRHRIFRRDGETAIHGAEEPTRRGQLLGMIDALRDWTPRDPESVALGIMLPGQGTRLSPLTQRLGGIKPFIPMPIRTPGNRGWLSAAAASLHSWVLVTDALARAGFRGIAWKWGDEPQLPSVDLDALGLDLRTADAVRFGKPAEITEDLARNKEWLLCSDRNTLVAQVRRRPADALRERLAQAGDGARALVHIGSPALSYRFVRALVDSFGALDGWLDIDGYLFEALTHDRDAWQREAERDAGIGKLLAGCPDFYERTQAMKARLEDERGGPLHIAVVDCGADTWWGDMGQLSSAHLAFARLAEPDAEGEFARRLAAIEHVVPDAYGNRVLDARIPDDGRVRDSVVVGSWIGDDAMIRASVIIDSDLDRAVLERGTVVIDSSIDSLHVSAGGWVFGAVGDHVVVGPGHVHTTIVADPLHGSEQGGEPARFESWSFDRALDPSAGELWTHPVAPNPTSFASKAAQMRQRVRPPAALDADFAAARAAVRSRMRPLGPDEPR